MARLNNPSATEAVGEALTADAALQNRRELRLAARILGVLVIVVALIVTIVVFYGIPALTLIALVGAAGMLILLLAYASGY